MAIAAADAAYPIAMRADAVTGRKFGLVNCSNSSSTRKYAASNEGFLGCGQIRLARRLSSRLAYRGTKSSRGRFPLGPFNTHRRNTMARDEHNKAAEHHENAAKSHRAAAEHHGKGDHAKGKEHSSSAQQHSQNARQHSEQAHAKSQQQK